MYIEQTDNYVYNQTESWLLVIMIQYTASFVHSHHTHKTDSEVDIHFKILPTQHTSFPEFPLLMVNNNVSK